MSEEASPVRQSSKDAQQDFTIECDSDGEFPVVHEQFVRIANVSRTRGLEDKRREGENDPAPSSIAVDRLSYVRLRSFPTIHNCPAVILVVRDGSEAADYLVITDIGIG